MIIEKGEYKGWPIITLKRSRIDRYPLSFGLAWARLLIANIEVIEKFISIHPKPATVSSNILSGSATPKDESSFGRKNYREKSAFSVLPELVNTPVVDKEHLIYLGKENFPVKCSTAIFTDEEIELLKRYGNWFEALGMRKIRALTKDQEQFVSVCQGERAPVGKYEKIWRKLQRRLAWERNPENKTHYKWRDPGEEWFSRSAVGKLSPGPKHFKKRKR